MADATITVGAVLDGSFSNIESQLISRLKALESSAKIKAKVELDTSGLQKEISGITASGSGRKGMFANITAGVNDVADAAKSAGKATAAMVGKPIEIGSKKYATALTQIGTLLSQNEKNTQKWTKAEYGKTADLFQYYKAQRDALQDLSAQLRAGAVDENTYSQRISNIRSTMKECEMGIRYAGEATASFGTKMKNSLQKFGQYFGVSRIIYAAVREVKAMASASIEVESAMNRIQIVTGASDREMSTFFTTAAMQARELGKSITDVAASIETFSRLGYNIEDASQLSKFATIMSNVGDTDVDSATTGITSIIKGYGLTPGDAEHVSDVLVTVGKNYAISAEELMTAFERGGAALSASGTDFEKSAALFAATNASLQNAQMTGTMWKTVSARIRGATSELEEMGEDTTGLAEGLSKYRDEIMALSGVDIMKNENEYKDMYTIFTELASVWDNINGDEAKARVAEILGGTRQLSGIMSTIMNIKDAEGAYSDAMNSAGESARANDKYMETTAAHIGQLKATFQEFSSDFVNSTFLKGLVDTGNTLLGILDAIVSKLGVLGTVAAGVGLFKIAKAGHGAGGIKGLLHRFGSKSSSGLGLFDGAMARGAAETAGVTAAEGAAMGSAAGEGNKLLGVLKALGPAGIAVAAAGTAVLIGMYRMANGYKYAKKESDDAIATYNQTKTELDSVNSELDTTRTRLSELEGKKLTPLEQQEYDRLREYNDQLESQKKTLENISEIQKKDAATKAEKALEKTRYVDGGKNDTVGITGRGRAPASKIGTRQAVSGGNTPLGLIKDRTNEIEQYEKEQKENIKKAERASSEMVKWDHAREKTKKKFDKLSVTDRMGLFGTDEQIAKDQKVVDDYSNAIKKHKKAQDDYDSASKQSELLKAKIAKSEKERAEYLDEIQPQIEAIRAYNPDSDYVKEYDKLVAEINAKTPMDKLDAFFNRSAGSKSIKSLLQDAYEEGRNLQDVLDGVGVSLSDLGVESIDQLSSYFRDAAKAAKDAEGAASDYRKNVDDIEKATESENQDKNWSTVQAAYQSARNMLKEGQTGTDDFQTMAQFLSEKDIAKKAQAAVKRAGKYADKGGSEAAKAYEGAFRAAMKTADRWFGEDETQSMRNFVKDFETKGLFDVTKDSMGRWNLDAKFNTTADAAKKFGMSVESVETMLKSLESYGYNFDGITKSGEALHDYTSTLDKLKELRESSPDQSVIGQDHLGKMIQGFDSEYNTFRNDLSKLSEEQVVKIKFEYDLASIQTEIDKVRRDIENNGGVNTENSQNYTELIGLNQEYISEATKGLGVGRDGVKMPVMFEASKKSEAELRAQLKKATSEEERVELKAQIANETELQKSILNALDEDPKITPDMDVSKMNDEIQKFDDETLTVTAVLNSDQVESYLAENQTGTITFQANMDGVERTVTAYKDENGEIRYQTVIDGQLVDVQLDKNGTITYKVNDTEPKNYKAPEKTSSVSYNVNDSSVRSYVPPNKTATVYYDQKEAGKRRSSNQGGSTGVNGTAYRHGRSYATGDWGASGDGTALGGELGTELLVRNGRWYTIGDNGAEFFKYKKDDIIFNADQTEQLFKNGKITYGNTRGTALAQGTAFNLKDGGGSGGKPKKAKAKKSGKKSKSNKKSKTAMDKFQDWFAKLFDWIEIRLERQAKKIENFTHKAERAAKQGNASAAEKQYKNAISAERTQMYNAAKGAKRYDAQANAVLNKAMNTKNKKGKALLSGSAAKTIKARVADGTIDISSYSKNLQEIIKDYQQWYDKARECEDKVKEMSEAIVDTYKEIADTYKETAEARINLLRKQSSNATSAAKKNSYLEKAAKDYDSIVESDRNAIAGLQQELNSSKSAVTGAGTVAKTKTALKTNYKKGQKVNGKKLTSAQAKKLNAANKATNSANAKKTKEAAAAAEKAKSEAKAGKKISNINALYSYYNSGFLSGSFYEACVRYNQMVDYGPGAIAELQNQLAEDTEEAKAEKIAIGTEMVENVQKEYERKLNALQAKQNLLTTSGYEMQKNDYDELNAMLSAEKNAIQSAIDRNVALGYWTTSTAEYLDAVNDLSEISESIQENINAIAQLPYDEIEKALDLLDAVADYNKSLSDFRSAAGSDLSASDYETQMEDNRRKIAEYEKQALQAYKDLQAAEANGGFIYGKTAKEYEVMYYEALSNINSLKESNEELRDDLRDDVYWRTFERAHDAAQRLLEVVSGIASLISDDMYFKNGKLTEFGAAQIANLTKQYELARQEVQNYSSDIANLNRLLAAGEYTNEEYKEKLAELQNGLLDAARDMKSYMSDIMDMYKELDQAQLDALFKLIDARNDALNAKKEYYDYDKTIKSKTKDIQELTAQIAALEGINTAEAKAQRAKLQEQLAEAQEDLEDTERDHYYQMMQDGLSDLKETLQDQFDDKWEYLSQDLARVAGLLESANELSATNAETINKTLTNLLSFYGINAAETGIDAAYASGTRRVNGRKVALSNESGSELIVTKNGLISHFKPGDGVVPADLTARLYDLAQGVKPGSSLGAANLSGLSGSRGMTVNQNYDSLIHIDGSADAATVSDLKRMSKNLLEMSYDYTSKRIQQDYTRTGGLRRA